MPPRSGNAYGSTKSWGPEEVGVLVRQKGCLAEGVGGDPAMDQGEKVSGSFYLMIWEIQSVGASDWMSLKCLESSSQLA